MSKKLFKSPFILGLSIDDEGDDTVIGGGTGQSSTDIWACSFEDWMTMYGEDLNGDGYTDFNDYRKWWLDNEFDEDTWDLFNDDPLYPEEP